MKDYWEFVKAAIANPREFGTVFPASKYLAEEMTRKLAIQPDDIVVELGPGTGPITASIASLLVSADQYLGIELNEPMVYVLRERFSELKFVIDSAENIGNHLPKGKKAALIFSSLPWALFSPEMQDTIFEAITKNLADNGRFIAYGLTSGLKSPTSKYFQSLLDRNFARVEKSSTVWLNLPPATVFRCQVARRAG